MLKANDARENPLGIQGIDHVQLYVGNADQAAHYYSAAFGFQILAYAGPDTKVRDRRSLVLEQGDARLVVSSGLDPDSPVARHAALHGDGVKDIAFRVPDAEGAFDRAVRQGARPVREPVRLEDEHGEVRVATIAAFGDTLHSFVERDQYRGAFLPNYAARPPLRRRKRRFTGFDHFAVALPAGSLDGWVDFYQRVFGFQETFEQNVTTSRTGMRSKVVRGVSDDTVFPLLEPVPGPHRSQVQEFLNFNCGPGVQHAALRTDDIVAAVRSLAREGIEFLHTPDGYYDDLPARVGEVGTDPSIFRQYRIMVDRDESGHLLQIFTKAIAGRPTFFLELIERKGSRGFGGGNIRALFEAVEREQAAREAGSTEAGERREVERV
uniref:4-hydroxyphenylpyruvate dioxygenase n=1 Tax=uncultured bacterium AZ_379 TaxID=1630015 RepID=A0A0E3GLX0_9BACT|nr:4-hydroxyphenylpyruvate dioxygenase [uncultured bacterium AZ_379]